ncbi:trypsin-like serine protease, partial [Streptomyces nojiriensis]|uniref:trypsin-like serine protease n=1 Tax=Streptomyces nojiriensis TaxID=66374 RepID=UPI003663055B
MRIRRWLPAATLTTSLATTLALAIPAPLASADSVAPANADAPFIVEDGSYPYRTAIQSVTGAELIAGDGNIIHTSCSGPYQIMVWARNLLTSDSRICFKAAHTGYLAVNIPRAYRIETSDRDVRASISIAGQTSTVNVPKDTTKGFGESDPADPQRAVMMELRITGSTGAPAQPSGDTTYAFTGKLTVGDNKRFCTATLVDPRWVVAAKSCFADKPAENNTVAAGAPAEKTTLTVGRSDLATTGGHTTDIVELVPRADRDLVMARLDQPAYDVTPVALSSAAPAAGQELTVAGFGRTQTEWMPTKVHTAAFTVGTVAATGFDLTAKNPADAALCKGDAGAPALRTVNGKPALAALGSRSRQGACLDSTEPKSGAYDTRTDDISGWIQDTTRRDIVRRDVNGDGRSDGVMAYYHPDGSIGFYSALGKADGGFGEFNVGYKVPAKSWDRGSMKLITGDFNGDRRSDVGMMYRFSDGSVKMYTGLANTAGLIQPFTSSYEVPANAGWDWNAIELHSGDVNGDGRSDAVMAYYHSDGSIGFYSALGKADGGFGEFNVGYKVPAKSWDRGSMKLITGDFNGDRRSDVGMMYRFSDG